MGKGEIARNEQFLLFPQCFKKAHYPGASKGVIVWEWVNQLPHNAAFWRTKDMKLWKTLWEKEKLLVTSNFSFSHHVFLHYMTLIFHFKCTLKISLVICFNLDQSKILSPHKGLTHSQTNPGFYVSVSLLKTLWEKEKLLITSNSSFSHSVFYPFGKFSGIFINFKIVVCKPFQFGRV